MRALAALAVSAIFLCAATPNQKITVRSASKASAAPKAKAAPKQAAKVPPPPPPVPRPAEPDAGAAADLWDFDGVAAKVFASAETSDPLSSAALAQMGVQLQGVAYLKVSAHANTVGGVTLRLEDANDPRVNCALYATRQADYLRFKDSRCVFPVFAANMNATATCRGISGSARRVKGAIALDATTPDCTATPMGFAISLTASAVPAP